MKKLMCLLVVFLISNAANAADKWEYVEFMSTHKEGLALGLTYPDGKMEVWNKKLNNPPKGFEVFYVLRAVIPFVPIAIVFKKDFSKKINVINALGDLGFEMCGLSADSAGTTYWFKRKIK